MLCEVKTLYTQNCRDIPKTLRLIADQIEAGDYPDANEAVLVLSGSEFDVFGIGEADSGAAHILLACAMRKLENAVLSAKGE